MSDAVTDAASAYNVRINSLMGKLWDVYTCTDPEAATKVNRVWDLLVAFDAEVREDQAAIAALATQPQDQRIAELEAERKEAALQSLAHLGQAGEAYEKQLAAEAERDQMESELTRVEQVIGESRAREAQLAAQVLALREALVARLKHDAKLTEKMTQYLVPAVAPDSIEADEFISAAIEHLDGPQQRKNDEIANKALASTKPTPQAQRIVELEEVERALKLSGKVNLSLMETTSEICSERDQALAHAEQLREALKDARIVACAYLSTQPLSASEGRAVLDPIDAALSLTPPQDLSERDERIRAEERERCAQIADANANSLEEIKSETMDDRYSGAINNSRDIANAIRDLSSKGEG